MRLSQFFLPTLKETPSEAQIASHRLMLRAGMVRQLKIRSETLGLRINTRGDRSLIAFSHPKRG